jgi:hypothetical protein
VLLRAVRWASTRTRRSMGSFAGCRRSSYRGGAPATHSFTFTRTPQGWLKVDTDVTEQEVNELFQQQVVHYRPIVMYFVPDTTAYVERRNSVSRPRDASSVCLSAGSSCGSCPARWSRRCSSGEHAVRASASRGSYPTATRCRCHPCDWSRWPVNPMQRLLWQCVRSAAVWLFAANRRSACVSVRRVHRRDALR